MTGKRESNVKTALMVAAMFAAVVLAAFAVNVRFFRITEIEIRGNGKISTKEILKRSGLKEGVSASFFSEERASALILKNPRILDVKITKEFPRRAVIEVEEISPLCLTLGEDGRPYYIGENGKNLGRANFYEGLDFPLLIGEGIWNSELLGEAFDIIKLSSKSEILSARDISEINVDSVYGIRVFTNDRRRIDFGKESVAEKWHRVEKIIIHSRSINLTERYINISSKTTAVVDFKL
ncbi:MAG: cell division protein FtsQ/DivIB [Deltaproteobacteria bacterium]